jgi:rubrerythrin
MDGKTSDLMLLRDILAREVSTINNYQSLLSQANSREVATFISHILEEEKEHVAEAIELIKELDPNQAALLTKGSHWNTERSIADLKKDKVETFTEGLEPRQAWTVGSLRGEKIR